MSADLVAELAKTRKKETIRKMIVHLAMLLDHAGVSQSGTLRKTDDFVSWSRVAFLM